MKKGTLGCGRLSAATSAAPFVRRATLSRGLPAMSLPDRHELPDGTPVYAGGRYPFDENGVDLTLVDEMLARTPDARLAWLGETVALVEALRAGLERAPQGDPARS